MSGNQVSHTGVVVDVTPGGLGIVKDKATGHAYYFTFGEIPGYRGESASEFGIVVGSHATFLTAAGSTAVTEIKIGSRVPDEVPVPERVKSGDS